MYFGAKLKIEYANLPCIEFSNMHIPIPGVYSLWFVSFDHQSGTHVTMY